MAYIDIPRLCKRERSCNADATHAAWGKIQLTCIDIPVTLLCKAASHTVHERDGYDYIH